MRSLLLCAWLAVFSLPAVAQMPETGFLDREVRVDGADYPYQVYVPRAYADSVTWPVILALHGSGERGSDGLLQTEVGLATAIRRHPERYPAIVVFPQSPLDSSGWRGGPAEAALAALDRTRAEFRTDAARVYLTGLSMGGNGAWYLAYHHAERFAALVVVCGFISELELPSGVHYPAIPAGSPADPFAAVATRLRGLPVWLFHGAADPVVPVAESRRMAAALRAAGADSRYTELAGVGHNAWDPAYSFPELPIWLLAQRRP